MTLVDLAPLAFPDRTVPPAPAPPAKHLGLFGTFRAARANPITMMPREAYRERFSHLRHILVVNDPKAIERVLVDNAANYLKSPQQRRRIEPGLRRGLLTAEGELWRAERRMTAPMFSPRAVARLQGDMAAAAEGMAARWRSEAPGPLDLAKEYQRLTYEIVSQSVFSGALDDDRALVHAMMARYFDTIGRIDLASFLNLPRWVPTLAEWRGRPALKTLHQVVERAVAGRMAAPAAEGAETDLLDRLLTARDPHTGESLTPDLVADNVLTFLAAGHETTGNALTWISYLIARFPWAEERLVAEIVSVSGDGPASVGDLDRLVFARALVEEAMRLYPPAPFLGRLSIGADELAGRAIPPGTNVLISPWLVHRHETLWQEPGLFQPERFLPERRQAIPRGAYLPFGLGTRICIGMGFAMQEILTVLSVLVPRFRFTLADATPPVPQTRITLTPRGGLFVRVTPR